ncbi:acyl-CoA carboxylase epsilon subunit [Timonella senegalensis]|uniref:acyl-CoA carboxylase epsilon subunit n=1 Tax=Timonella senegalensis TaxID=1465825 RepID=UPI0028A8F29B|nr:acyl-CoA carboxylase epsilon subunit [Timonella senegalensis]
MSEATQEDILAAALAAATRVQVVGGSPDDLEVVALVAGLAAVAGSADLDEAPLPPPSQWENRTRRLHPRALVPGADSWRWSLQG